MTAIVCQLDLHLPMQPVPITTNICSQLVSVLSDMTSKIWADFTKD
jgi:hypothetical protein